MTKVGIMQPYLFPYLGYFQLINAVDTFLLYDDVQYMQSSWINRNRILVNGKACFFNIHLKKSSNFDLIKDKSFSDNLDYNLNKFFRTLELSYRKAPYFEQTMAIVKQSFEHSTPNVLDVIEKSLMLVCGYLDIRTKIHRTSELEDSGINLKAEERVIFLNKQISGEQYINPIGGKELYSKSRFAEEDLTLNFLATDFTEYTQFDNEFVNGLSIIDILMFNSPREVRAMLSKYELV